MDIRFWVEEVVKLCSKGHYILDAIEIVKVRKEMFHNTGKEVSV
jgi:hypothetical protein